MRPVVFGLLIGAAGVLSLILTRPAEANNCRVGYSTPYYPTYRAPTYSAPYYPRYSAPVYSAPTYYAPPVTKIVKEVIVEKEYVPIAVAVPFQAIIPVSGYSYGGAAYSLAPATAMYPPTPSVQTQVAAPVAAPGPARAAVHADCTKQIAELRAYFEGRLAALQGNGGDTSGPPRATSPISTPTDEGPPGQPVKNQQPAEAGSVATRAVAILRRDCAGCHTGAKSKGGIVMFEDGGQLNPKADRTKIWDAADKGRMPKEAQNNIEMALTDADVDVLKAWKDSKDLN